ncbi:MAG: hypothetical protein HC835_13970 [Oscillatoriales cyanobacterium RM2_1_1]|nr:hypothetical protein [Oscillatoriales cyanobacterium SM2_3_0]NJO46637.1 hypothetical protein [Oscillatoriales cyanobacterium RM2_1_1]
MLAKIETHGVVDMDTKQIFPLIDAILPFEVCLHYQVLPLSLNQKHLCLGMVDLEDQSALDYVNRILSYQGYAIDFQPISPEDQQNILSAYLCHTQQTPAEIETIASDRSPSKPAKSQTKSRSKISSASSDSSESSQQAESQESKSHLASTVPVLKLHAKHLSSSLDILGSLSPEDLIQELLARVLLGGIGRLYFERQAALGRILWSQDGVLKSILDNIDPPRYQWILNELKRFAGVALAPVEQLKQLELERTYRGQHLLLRLRLVPGEYGEEANLQVLRGAALRFYQQQQLSVLSQDALTLAQQLQKKLSEINDRVIFAPVLSENLPLLNQLLKILTQQTESIIELNGHSDGD